MPLLWPFQKGPKIGKSNLTQADLDRILDLDSEYRTDYTYAASRSYRRDGPVDYEHPIMSRYPIGYYRRKWAYERAWEAGITYYVCFCVLMFLHRIWTFPILVGKLFLRKVFGYDISSRQAYIGKLKNISPTRRRYECERRFSLTSDEYNEALTPRISVNSESSIPVIRYSSKRSESYKQRMLSYLEKIASAVLYILTFGIYRIFDEERSYRCRATSEEGNFEHHHFEPSQSTPLNSTANESDPPYSGFSGYLRLSSPSINTPFSYLEDESNVTDRITHRHRRKVSFSDAVQNTRLPDVQQSPSLPYFPLVKVFATAFRKIYSSAINAFKIVGEIIVFIVVIPFYFVSSAGHVLADWMKRLFLSETFHLISKRKCCAWLFWILLLPLLLLFVAVLLNQYRTEGDERITNTRERLAESLQDYLGLNGKTDEESPLMKGINYVRDASSSAIGATQEKLKDGGQNFIAIMEYGGDGLWSALKYAGDGAQDRLNSLQRLGEYSKSILSHAQKNIKNVSEEIIISIAEQVKYARDISVSAIKDGISEASLLLTSALDYLVWILEYLYTFWAHIFAFLTKPSPLDHPEETYDEQAIITGKTQSKDEKLFHQSTSSPEVVSTLQYPPFLDQRTVDERLDKYLESVRVSETREIQQRFAELEKRLLLHLKESINSIEATFNAKLTDSAKETGNVRNILSSEVSDLSSAVSNLQLIINKFENIKNGTGKEVTTSTKTEARDWSVDFNKMKSELAKSLKPEIEKIVDSSISKLNTPSTDTSQSVIQADLWKKIEGRLDTLFATHVTDVLQLRGNNKVTDTSKEVYHLSKEDFGAIKQFVVDLLETYDADKTGKVDYALESSGGSVVSTRCTETYSGRTRLESIFGIPLWYLSYSPRIVIQQRSTALSAGECWGFKDVGYLTIKLSKPVHVTEVSYEHVRRVLLPGGKAESAPRRFQVWAYQEVNDLDSKFLLGEYEYNMNGDALQFFTVQHHPDKPTPIVELVVQSNWGNTYTCLYRFRVHGEPSAIEAL